MNGKTLSCKWCRDAPMQCTQDMFSQSFSQVCHSFDWAMGTPSTSLHLHTCLEYRDSKHKFDLIPTSEIPQRQQLTHICPLIYSLPWKHAKTPWDERYVRMARVSKRSKTGKYIGYAHKTMQDYARLPFSSILKSYVQRLPEICFDRVCEMPGQPTPCVLAFIRQLPIESLHARFAEV